jgi:predicted nuclease with TOPRIM domain
MELAPEVLSEEISTLEVWINLRSDSLEQALQQQVERTRLVLRLTVPDSEIEREHQKLEVLRQELNRLDESRQALECKKQLLQKWGDSKRIAVKKAIQ